jgi:hypothetical protein
MISKKIELRVVELKALIQKSMSPEAIEEATWALNGILAETERVAGLENNAQVPAGKRC